MGKVPDALNRQAWNSELTFQLCLWRLSLLPDIPYPSEINLLFQIIEITDPNYPKYEDSSNAPNPLTETKLLRHLVSHKQIKMGNDDLKKYCDFLGIPREFHDPTDKHVTEIIRKRIKIVKAEAQRIINDALSYSSG